MGIVLIGCCLVIVGSASILLKRKFEEIVPVFFCALIMLLQILAMFRWLSGISVILPAITLLFFIMCIFGKNRNVLFTEVNQYIFTFGALVFGIIIVLCVFIEYGRRVVYFDEFNFWATAIKMLWHYDGFATANEMWGIWEYPQGMPLIEWFGAYLLGSYSEWVFYAIRLIFDLSFLLPIFKNFYLRWYWAGIAAIIIFLFPSTANITSYTVLSVDGDLAFLFGYLLYCVLERSRKDVFYYIRLMLISGVIILTKSFSILFVGYGLLLLLLLELIEKKKKENWEKVMGVIVLLWPLLVLRGWNYYLSYVGNVSTRVTGRANLFLESFIKGTWEWTGYEIVFLKAFLRSFFVKPVSYFLKNENFYYNIGFSPFLFLVVVLGILMVLKKRGFISDKLWKLLSLFWMFVVVSYSAVFILTHCTILVGEIKRYCELDYLAISLGRYCAPVYLGVSVVMILELFDIAGEIINRKLSIGKKRLLASILIYTLICTNFNGVYKAIWALRDKNSERLVRLNEMKKELPEKFEWLDYIEEEEGKIYYLSLRYFDVYYIYELVPTIIQEPSSSYPIYGIGDLQNYLYEHEFKYIYYADNSIPEAIVEMCNTMLEDEIMEIGGLYKIDMTNVKFRLERVN